MTNFVSQWKEKCLVSDNPVTQRQFIFQKYYEDLFRPFGKNRQTIVEIGCGRCTIGQYFAKDGKSVECLDISQEAVDLARINFERAGLRGTFTRADALHLPLGRYDRKFKDAVVSVGLIEHLETGEWQRCLSEAYRILRPGGVLAMVNVPKKFSIQTFFQKHDHYHREALIPEDYVRACVQIGFRAVKYVYVNPFPLLETKHELFWSRVFRAVYWVRPWFTKQPMCGSKRWSQAHFLMAIK